MTIYIEDFIIQNVLINLCLLRLVSFTLKSKTNFFRLILVSIVGASSSVIVAVFIDNIVMLNCLKLISAIVMICCAYKCNFKEKIFAFLSLFLYTYAIGGLISSISSATYKTNFGIVTTSKFNLSSVCIIVILLTFIIEKIATILKHKFKSNTLVYNLKLTNKNHSINVKAYLDTGNFLSFHGQPVVVLSQSAFMKLNQINQIEFLCSPCEFLQTSTVNGTSRLKLYKIDEISFVVGKKQIKKANQYVAINSNPQFNKENYDALLSPLCL